MRLPNDLKAIYNPTAVVFAVGARSVHGIDHICIEMCDVPYFHSIVRPGMTAITSEKRFSS